MIRSKHITCTALVGVSLALGGCSFSAGPFNRLPGTLDQANFSVAPAVEAVQADQQWWTSFGNDELNQWVQLGIERNNNLRVAESRLRAAQAELDGATAGLFPTLSGSLARDERFVKGGSLSPVARSTSGYTTSAQLSAQYEVDLWSRVRSSRQAAQWSLQATEQDLEAARLSVAGQVATAWVQWLAAGQTVALLEQELQDYQTNLNLVEFRFKQGSAPASDVLQQRQLVESTQGSLATAQANAQLIGNSLATLTAQPLGQLKPPTGQLPELPPMPQTGVPAEVLMRRPDVRSAFNQIQAADQNVAAAMANQFPQLSFSASWSDQTRDSSLLFDNYIRNLSLNLVGPLFDGGARAAQTENQRARLAQSVAQYQQTALEALEEVDNALVQEASQVRVVDSLTKQLALSQQSLDRLFAGYRNGSVNYLNILNAQQSTSALKRNLVNAHQQLLVFRIALYRAISGGLSTTNPEST